MILMTGGCIWECNWRTEHILNDFSLQLSFFMSLWWLSLHRKKIPILIWFWLILELLISELNDWHQSQYHLWLKRNKSTATEDWFDVARLQDQLLNRLKICKKDLMIEIIYTLSNMKINCLCMSMLSLLKDHNIQRLQKVSWMSR